MIPADVDIDDLVSQVNEDGLALQTDSPELHEDLLAALNDVQSTDFGSAGMVVLDRTPDQTADLRDIAQTVLGQTSVDSVIVRSQTSGAIVSHVHSRADIESAQWYFLDNPDYPEATRNLAEHITTQAVDISMIVIALAALAVVAVVVTFVAALARARKQYTVT